LEAPFSGIALGFSKPPAPKSKGEPAKPTNFGLIGLEPFFRTAKGFSNPWPQVSKGEACQTNPFWFIGFPKQPRGASGTEVPRPDKPKVPIYRGFEHSRMLGFNPAQFKGAATTFNTL